MFLVVAMALFLVLLTVKKSNLDNGHFTIICYCGIEEIMHVIEATYLQTQDSIRLMLFIVYVQVQREASIYCQSCNSSHLPPDWRFDALHRVNPGSEESLNL